MLALLPWSTATRGPSSGNCRNSSPALSLLLLFYFKACLQLQLFKASLQLAGGMGWGVGVGRWAKARESTSPPNPPGHTLLQRGTKTCREMLWYPSRGPFWACVSLRGNGQLYTAVAFIENLCPGLPDSFHLSFLVLPSLDQSHLFNLAFGGGGV